MSRLRTLLHRGVRSKRAWGGMIGLALVGALSAYALYALVRSDAQGLSFGEALSRVSGEMFLAAGLVYVVDLALAILGWGLIVGQLSGVRRWAQHFRIYCITSVTRRLPGTVWYVFGRVMMYEQLGVSRSVVAIASGIEFAAIILGGLLAALLTWPIALSIQSINPLWMVAGLALGALLLNPWVLRRVLRRFSKPDAPLDLRYRHLLAWVLLYALVWAVGGGVLFVLATTVHPMPLAMLPAIVGVWAVSGLISTLLSFVPFGLVQEFTLAGLLAPYIGPHEAVIVALLMRGVLTINEVLWAAIAGMLALANRAEKPPAGMVLSDAGESTNPHSDAEKSKELYEVPPLIRPK